jgi:hypothetical protein
MRIVFLVMYLIAFSSLIADEASAPASFAESIGIKDPEKLLAEQLSTLDHLIEMTKLSLKNQQALRQQIQDYQKIQELYLQNTHDNDLLFRMVKLAARILESIKENHLAQNFDTEFISELTLFSQIANKRGIPKPKQSG